jgi:adenylate cyclase
MHYLSDGILQYVLKSPDALALGGKKRPVTILMSDIRSFTLLSEKMNVEDVVTLLNHYLAIMIDVIHKYSGTIIEFVGDGILVVFNAPFEDEKHADQAVACAIAMQKEMVKVNKWNTENSFPEIDMGIGINTGEIIVGNIGSDKIMKYNVIGSHVNLTSRIESLTTGGHVLISEHTFNAVTSKLSVAQAVTFHPKGIPTPISVYDIDGIEEPYNLSIKEKAQKVFVLPKPLPVLCYKINDKQVELHAKNCYIKEISGKEAIISSEQDFEIFDNIKLCLENSETEVFAKIIDLLSDENVKVRFTSKVEEFFAQAKQK